MGKGSEIPHQRGAVQTAFLVRAPGGGPPAGVQRGESELPEDRQHRHQARDGQARLSGQDVEADGGSQTTWKCSATVKYNSKAYGFDLQIPLNSRDDIVWRGHLSHRYIEKYSGIPSHFGDVDIVLELI